MRCNVEGCGRRSHVTVTFADERPVTFDEFLDPEDEDGKGLLVCMEHADMLGDPYDLVVRLQERYGQEIDSGESWHVEIDPAKAEGWRIAVMVRASGAMPVVLFPPEVTS